MPSRFWVLTLSQNQYYDAESLLWISRRISTSEMRTNLTRPMILDVHRRSNLNLLPGILGSIFLWRMIWTFGSNNEDIPINLHLQRPFQPKKRWHMVPKILDLPWWFQFLSNDITTFITAFLTEIDSQGLQFLLNNFGWPNRQIHVEKNANFGEVQGVFFLRWCFLAN